MTTSTDNPRSIDEIIDLPYSELTEEEIELVIEFKVSVQTRDNLHNAAMKKLDEHLKQAAAENKRAADAAIERLDQLTANALNRYEETNG